MIRTLQKCLKRFKVTSFKYQNEVFDIKLLIMIVAENVGSNSSRFSGIFSGCFHCQWSAPAEAAGTHTQRAEVSGNYVPWGRPYLLTDGHTV